VHDLSDDSEGVLSLSPLIRGIDDEVKYLHRKEKLISDTTRLTSPQIYSRYHDFTIINGKIILVGYYNIIKIFDIHLEDLKVVSDFSQYNFNNNIPPIEISDNSYLLTIGGYYTTSYFEPYFYLTDTDFNTIVPVVDMNSQSFKTEYPEYGYSRMRYRFYYYNKSNQELYLGGKKDFDTYETNIFHSTDLAGSFSPKVKDFNLFVNKYNYYLANAPYLFNHCKVDDGFYIISGHGNAPNYHCIIQKLDNNFNFVDSLIFSHFAIDYIGSIGNNELLIHGANIAESLVSEIRRVSMNGKSVDVFHKFDKSDTLLAHKEISLNNKKMFALLHKRYISDLDVTEVSLDIVEFENLKLKHVTSWRFENYLISQDLGVVLDSDNENVYLGIVDTLFVISDLDDRNTWKYYNLPLKNSRMYKPMVKLKNGFYCRFIEDYTSFEIWSIVSPFILKPIREPKSLVSVAENEIEQKNYLYTYPPYPMPARSEVRAKIYFDSSTEISVENMAVYDIYGRKLPTKESLRLEQETFYSGYIIWDCAGVEPGVYIIRINHGTEVRAVKVMVGM
jgi:hypothetical protein